jgi:hypothetical protein
MGEKLVSDTPDYASGQLDVVVGERPDRYGATRISRIRKRWNALREAVRAEGTPAVQDAFDQMEGFDTILQDPRNREATPPEDA